MQRPASSRANDRRDVIVIGGGPAGAVAGRVLALEGIDVLLLERTAHPRFHIGESFLPRNAQQFRELGLGERIARIPHVAKPGVDFVMGHGRDKKTEFTFSQRLSRGETRAFNIERAPFDRMLLDASRDAGVEVRENVTVRRIVRLEEGDVAVEAGGETLCARHLIDASGQAAFVGRHLGTRRIHPSHRKVAYFGHFAGVERDAGLAGGSPLIVMCSEGWFWLIPIDEERMSIGLVIDEQASRRIGVPAKRMLEWGIRRCSELSRRCADASFPDETFVNADFSYSCAPFAGPGYFLVGDAAAFIDPIFSTGVCLGTMSGEHVARGLAGVIRHGHDVRRLRRRHIAFVRGSTAPLFKLIQNFYDDAFRDLFLEGRGPLSVHRALMDVLAGDVFPLPFRCRWRLAFMDLCVRVQRWKAIAPRREPFHLSRQQEAAPEDRAVLAGDLS